MNYEQRIRLLEERLYDVPILWGQGEFGLVYARSTSDRDADGNSAPDTDGLAFTFLHTRDRFISCNSLNKL